ncbi:MAG: 4Fe-4S ferredoxin [Spirochaetes bacterium GWD1_27_9]|nr:MAG: 4Fe-4S ferredoxin [Spirochaetes bacterium GWB1_27_13]OHD21485.1 MAG: 4Fe-4S ferredoxin [Spirochaetes bacterium GWC1_27_15]OHD42449.1 MAG: 4Fe-4S ferredoxin [Spirochaetes bacterium GWD1_27_9]
MKRKIININTDKCNGCGLCVPNCPEGAIQIIDGKARLISDIFCDGLGACIGHCPEGAILIEEREAEEYDEKKAMANIVKQGENTIIAHLKHLKDHGETKLLNLAIEYLKENNHKVPNFSEKPVLSHEGGCPGSKMMNIQKKTTSNNNDSSVKLESELSQWPIQLQLLNPMAQYFDNADIVVAADCVPFAYPDFHRKFLKGKILVIFCPKLDKTIENYIDKLATIFKEHTIKSITMVHMEVPCCFGTNSVVEEALKKSGKNILIKEYTISINGEIV